MPEISTAENNCPKFTLNMIFSYDIETYSHEIQISIYVRFQMISCDFFDVMYHEILLGAAVKTNL